MFQSNKGKLGNPLHLKHIYENNKEIKKIKKI